MQLWRHWIVTSVRFQPFNLERLSQTKDKELHKYGYSYNIYFFIVTSMCIFIKLFIIWMTEMNLHRHQFIYLESNKYTL